MAGRLSVQEGRCLVAYGGSLVGAGGSLVACRLSVQETRHHHRRHLSASDTIPAEGASVQEINRTSRRYSIMNVRSCNPSPSGQSDIAY